MSKLKVKKIESTDNSPIEIKGDIIFSGNVSIVGTITANTITVVSSTTSNNNILPLNYSVGENSIIQKGDSNYYSFGKNSVSFGDFNNSNGDYSTTFGSNNITGSKSYEFSKINNTNLLLIIGENANPDFTKGKPGQIQLSAVCSGSTVISTYRTYVRSVTPYINDCYSYMITYNRTIPCTCYNYIFTYANGATPSTTFTYRNCANNIITVTLPIPVPNPITGIVPPLTLSCVTELIYYSSFNWSVTREDTNCCSGQTKTLPLVGFSYVDCETNTTKLITNISKPICSKTIPTYIIPPQYSGDTELIENNITITRIGKCCENKITTTATTYSRKLITTTASTATILPLAYTGCVKYNVHCNSHSGGALNYTRCSGSATTEYYPYTPNTSPGFNICSSTVPTWVGSSTLFTITPVSNCCSYYTVKNFSSNTYIWPLVDCVTGLITNITIRPGKEYGSCAAFPPPPSIPRDLWFEAPGGEFCQRSYKIVCSSYTTTEITKIVTSACSFTNLILTGECVTYRFTNNNQTNTTADDNVFWRDCDGIDRSFKLKGSSFASCGGSSIDVCAIKDSAYAISGISITETYSGCCVDNYSQISTDILHNFSYYSGSFLDTELPSRDLVLDNNILYGTAFFSGGYGNGFIFSYDVNSTTYQVLHNFDVDFRLYFRPQDGGYPLETGLFKASNNKLYGITADYIDYNNIHYDGAIFSYDIGTNQYSFLNFFDNTSGLYHGTGHSSLLMEPSTDIGVLYGATYASINGVASVIYKYDIISNTIIELLDLTSLPLNSQCFNIVTQFYELTPGILYSTSFYGGQNNCGVIFKYEISTNTYTVLHHFNGIDGASPSFTKWAEKNGTLYGVTEGGGVNNLGTIFSYDNINGFIKLYDFCYSSNLANPSSIMMGSDGKLYLNGNCWLNGVYSFDVNTRTLTNLSYFVSNNISRIASGTLIEINNKLYGTAQGFFTSNELGSLFSVDMPILCANGLTESQINTEIDDVNLYRIIERYDYNAIAFDGIDKSYFNVLSITTGYTNSNGIISGINLINLPPNTIYTLLEIDPDVPSNIDFGKIVPNNLGDSSTAEGIGTQAKGFASHSEGIGTIANADGSHAGGIGAVTNNTGEFARSNGSGTQYSILSMNGFTSGSTFSYLTLDGGYTENPQDGIIKVPKGTLVTMEILINAIIVNSENENLIGTGFSTKGGSINFMNGSNNGGTLGLNTFSDDNLELGPFPIVFLNKSLIEDENYDAISIQIDPNGSSWDLKWNAMVTLLQTKI